MQLLGRHLGESQVAFGKKGVRCASDLLRDVATVAESLPRSEPGKECLLCFSGDRYEFAVALLATWQVGLRAVLPPNLQIETISRLIESPQRVALLHDTQVAGHQLVSELLSSPSGDARPLDVPSGVVASVLTSGSTGENQIWQKTYQQLVDEVATWSRVLAADEPPRVVATVQPGHLYGLLFSVLYPLCTGGSFCREIPFAPEAVAESVRVHSANTLVTVPVHLRATHILEPGRLAGLKCVLSSTAPLHAQDERIFRETHHVAITEIFGSTETGGIAFRKRSLNDRWTPLPDLFVHESPEGRLVVDSPFASVGLARPYETRDRVRFWDDGGFEPLGRDDSVVKIGGKRVPFLEQEAWLLEQEEVADAAIVDVPDPVRGTRLLALVAGEEHHQAELRRRMADRFGASVVPKRFVMVHELPRGPNGKLSRKNALSLFRIGSDGQPLPEDVEVTQLKVDPTTDELSATLVVPENFVWFQGHFDGYPVMAGVVQLLAMVMPTLRRQVPQLGEIQKMDALKFTGRIGPGDTLEFSARLELAETRASFSVSKDGRSLTAGKLRFFSSEGPEGSGTGRSEVQP